jgi:ElaA protein
MVQWTLKKFDDLTSLEIYQVLQLRSTVFVVEQNCIYLDMDDKDQLCYHLMGYFEGSLIAYTRLIPPGIVYPQASIGRVVTSPQSRKKGLGKLLMEQSIARLHALFGNGPIKIGAQLYLQQFDEGFAFHRCSDIYLEDGIEHVEMIRP